MRKVFLPYFLTLLVFGLGIFITLHLGVRLQSVQSGPDQRNLPSISANSPPDGTVQFIARNIAGASRENLRNPLSVLLLQVIVILATAKIVGGLVRKLNQPRVVGEMISGILLGPSLLGWLSPGTMRFIFPPLSLESLGLLSQVGIILFLFIVGSDLDPKDIRQKLSSVVLISHASIIVPFFLGMAFSLLIFRSLAPANVSFTAFALFMGLAMSITAFPVLVRIIAERGLSKSQVGSISLACAAIGDVTAWCLLVLVIAIVKTGGWPSALLTILLVLLYIMVMLFVIKPQTDRFILARTKDETQSRMLTLSLLLFLFMSALFTQAIGIHALFGAFLAGMILPSDANLRRFLTDRLELITVSFMLPLFFAYTGLRTQVGLLNDWSSWFTCAGVIAVAILGKLGGTMLAAYWTGMRRSDSFTLGILLNTRGLMELIVLNIGYELGILSPRIFSMMVLMALSTTFMAGPLLSLVKFQMRKDVELANETGIAV
jgi:Kef-type K+ transport system membrane component KefB